MCANCERGELAEIKYRLSSLSLLLSLLHPGGSAVLYRAGLLLQTCVWNFAFYHFLIFLLIANLDSTNRYVDRVVRYRTSAKSYEWQRLAFAELFAAVLPPNIYLGRSLSPKMLFP